MQKRLKTSRSALIFLTCVLAVPTTFSMLYGTPENADLQSFAPLLAVGAVLGAAHVFLRPLLRLLTAPLGCLTLGLSGTVIDVALIYLSAAFVPNLHAPDLLYALLTALLINAISFIVGARR